MEIAVVAPAAVAIVAAEMALNIVPPRAGEAVLRIATLPIVTDMVCVVFAPTWKVN